MLLGLGRAALGLTFAAWCFAPVVLGLVAPGVLGLALAAPGRAFEALGPTSAVVLNLVLSLALVGLAALAPWLVTALDLTVAGVGFDFAAVGLGFGAMLPVGASIGGVLDGNFWVVQSIR